MVVKSPAPARASPPHCHLKRYVTSWSRLLVVQQECCRSSKYDCRPNRGVGDAGQCRQFASGGYILFDAQRTLKPFTDIADRLSSSRLKSDAAWALPSKPAFNRNQSSAKSSPLPTEHVDLIILGSNIRMITGRVFFGHLVDAIPAGQPARSQSSVRPSCTLVKGHS